MPKPRSGFGNVTAAEPQGPQAAEGGDASQRLRRHFFKRLAVDSTHAVQEGQSFKSDPIAQTSPGPP